MFYEDRFVNEWISKLAITNVTVFVFLMITSVLLLLLFHASQKRAGRALLLPILTFMSVFNLEPNNYRSIHGRAVNGSQLGKDYIQLRSLLQPIRIYSRASLYGPSIGRPRKNVIALLDG